MYLDPKKCFFEKLNIDISTFFICLSPVRGSYSGKIHSVITCRKFVPRAGELFCLLLSKMNLIFSLSPVRGSYSFSWKWNYCAWKVCPPCGGVIPSSDRTLFVYKSLSPVQGSYSEKWLKDFKGKRVCPRMGSYSDLNLNHKTPPSLFPHGGVILNITTNN